MTKGTVPGRDKADNTSGCQAALNDRPLSADFMMARAHALTPRPNTRLQPFRFADDRNLELHCCYLIGESIHELLDILPATRVEIRKSLANRTEVNIFADVLLAE